MYDFDSLIDEVLRSRPELNREEIMSQIQERKKEVGAGFLTDQGALFLIAGELGVPLHHMTTTDLSLKDLYVGANDITIVARVLAIYPVSEYNKKKDGGTGRYRRLVLFDKGTQSKLTIWEDNIEGIKLEGIAVDSPVRVLNGYVRQGLDGKPALNLGRKGKIEMLGDEKLVSKLASLSTISRNVDEIGDAQELGAIEGLVTSDSRSSVFTRQDGSSGSFTRFELRGKSGPSKTRVVIWNASDVKLQVGQNVLVTNVRVKKNMYGEMELHGDQGSLVRVIDGSKEVQRVVKVNEIRDVQRKYSVEVMALSAPVIEEVTLKDGSSVQKAELTFADETGEITVVGWRGIVDSLSKIGVGEKVRITDAMSQQTKLGDLALELETESKIERLSG
jgi:hypothetical protein